MTLMPLFEVAAAAASAAARRSTPPNARAQLVGGGARSCRPIDAANLLQRRRRISLARSLAHLTCHGAWNVFVPLGDRALEVGAGWWGRLALNGG